MSVANNASAPAGSRAVVNASAMVFASSLALSVAGFAFHAFASRRLGVDAYGAFYALVSLYTLASLPVGVLSPVVTRYSAEFAALHDDRHMRGLTGLIVRAFGLFGALYVVGGVALAVPIAAWLHVSMWEVPIVGLMAGVGVLSSAMRAIGQGVQAYGTYAWSMTGEGIAKVLALVCAALIGLSVFGAVASFLIGLLAGALLIAVPLLNRYRRFEKTPIVLDWKRIFATTGGAAVLALVMATMGFGDVLIVKHVFSAQDAGLYAATSLCGKILLYFVGFVPAILIPQATHRHARGERTRRLLWGAILFIVAVSVFGVIAFALAGNIVLHLLTGNAFDAALPLLPPYAAAMAALALTNSLGSYGLSTHRLGFAIPLLLTAFATLAAIALHHPSLYVVVLELLGGNLAMILAVGASLAIQRRSTAAAA